MKFTTKAALAGWSVAGYCAVGSIGAMMHPAATPANTPPPPEPAWKPWVLWHRIPALLAVLRGQGLIFRVAFPFGVGAEFVYGEVNAFESRFGGPSTLGRIGDTPPQTEVVPDFPPASWTPPDGWPRHDG